MFDHLWDIHVIDYWHISSVYLKDLLLKHGIYIHLSMSVHESSSHYGMTTTKFYNIAPLFNFTNELLDVYCTVLRTIKKKHVIAKV